MLHVVDALQEAVDLFAELDIADKASILAPRRHDAEREGSQWSEFQSCGDPVVQLGLQQREAVDPISIPVRLVDAQENLAIVIQEIEMGDALPVSQPGEQGRHFSEQCRPVPVLESGEDLRVHGEDLE